MADQLHLQLVAEADERQIFLYNHGLKFKVQLKSILAYT